LNGAGEASTLSRWDRPAGGVLDDLLEERSTLTRRLLGQGGSDTDGHPFPAMRHALHAAGLPIPPAETP
jgi:hypothetical protein